MRIAYICEKSSPLSGEIGVDEFYFGASRVKGKRGRGALEKTIVFGLLSRCGYKKHYRVHYGENEFARGNSRINGMESFWSYVKRRLAKFNGIPKATFYVHRKECEFRFNHRGENLYAKILSIFRKIHSKVI